MADDDRSRISPADEVERALHRAIFSEPCVLADIAGEQVAGGKLLRAQLALDAAEALGAIDATRWAAAVELIHEASIVHDDLQDGDRVRRGRPSAWVEHGAAQAINAGDFLLLLPFTTLKDEPNAALLMHALASASVSMARGQADEPNLVALLESAPADVAHAYARCIEQKTGALFGVAVEGAALLAGFTPERAARVARPFVEIGALFQIVDDVVDLYGDKGRDKWGNDVREGKVSALVAAHATLHPASAIDLARVLRLPRAATTDAIVADVASQFAQDGALASVAADVDARTQAIRANPALADAPRLVEVARRLVERITALLATGTQPGVLS